MLIASYISPKATPATTKAKLKREKKPKRVDDKPEMENGKRKIKHTKKEKG